MSRQSSCDVEEDFDRGRDIFPLEIDPNRK